MAQKIIRRPNEPQPAGPNLVFGRQFGDFPDQAKVAIPAVKLQQFRRPTMQMCSFYVLNWRHTSDSKFRKRFVMH